nr:hypothetical protein [Desulfobacterales bacterium]
MKDIIEISKLLEAWKDDPQSIKKAFVRLKEKLISKDHTLITFKPRPGISYSLRATVDNPNFRERPLFVMIDVVDDDPENRWLSVCFYGDMIEDPEEKGDLIPGGLLGEDGYCFDLYEADEAALSYVEARIDEAYQKALSL